MDDPLRDRRPPLEWAAASQVIEISEKIRCFEQLSTVIEADLIALDAAKIPAGWRDLMVTGTLEYGFADAQEDVAALEISLAAEITAVCQRCLQPFSFTVATSPRVLFSGPADELEEREGYELWEYSEEPMRPLDIAEEALIMAMPLSAMHDNMNECVDIEVIEVDERMTTPFANLRSQMDDEK